MDDNKQERNYGIDALRMLAMLFIVILHILGHGGILDSLKRLSINYEIAWLLEIIAYCGVDCFVIISGFVDFDKKTRYSHLGELWLRVVFYSVFCTLFAQVYSGKMNIKALFNSFFPIFNGKYWFFSAYFGMYLFSPLLKQVLCTMEEKDLFLAMSAILFVFTTLPLCQLDLFMLNGGSSVLWFLVLYLIGGMIKKYDLFSNKKSKTIIIIAALSIIVSWLSKFVFEQLFANIFHIDKDGGVLVHYFSPTIVLFSVCLLLLFQRMSFSEKKKKIIRFVTPKVFSVYLIHDNRLIRELFIEKKFVNLAEKPPIQLMCGVLCLSVIIFTICIFLDLPRELIAKHLHVRNKLDRYEEKAKKKFLLSGRKLEE